MPNNPNPPNAKFTRRIAALEDIAIGAGFLLKKLQARYGADFGEGMSEQVRACIKDCDQVGKLRQERAKSADAQRAAISRSTQ